jgi:hypothetical protein
MKDGAPEGRQPKPLSPLRGSDVFINAPTRG